MDNKSRNMDDSISGMSAALFITKDDSLASLLLDHGIKVRDFIVLSFLSDQGPMNTLRLARVVGIDPRTTKRALRRLAAANLVLHDPAPADDELESIARLTDLGQDIAERISNQLQ